MAARDANSGSTIDPGIVSRVAQGMRYALFGTKPAGWFSPADPIPPAVEGAAAQQQGVAGRQWDYPVGVNVTTRPRAYEPISFEALRALADNYDLLRLVLETRKDQLCSLEWTIGPRDKLKKPDATCDEITEFLQSPDHLHDWATWLRMVLEDLFVLDAPAIYVRKTNGGELYALEPIDGSTVKPVVDATGRLPIEGTAYQQILKGVPAVDYTREELIYRPRNVRTHKVYGYGPVEQIIATVNLALRRQMFVTDYFTSGTVPDALAGVPESWTLSQVREFQDYWDSLLTSEQGMSERRKLRFVPGEIARNFKETKQPPLKDMFDEWLARIVCYCFSIDVTPFVAQVNRAVAETNRAQSLAEGLGPLKQWVAGLVNGIIREHWNRTDLVLRWQDDVILDPLMRMQVDTGYVTAKVLHPDEVRADLGREPLDEKQKADLFPPDPALIEAEGGQPGQPGEKKPAAEAKDEPAKPAEKAYSGPPIHIHPPEVVVDVGAITLHAHIDGRTESQRIERAADAATPEA